MPPDGGSSVAQAPDDERVARSLTAMDARRSCGQIEASLAPCRRLLVGACMKICHAVQASPGAARRASMPPRWHPSLRRRTMIRARRRTMIRASRACPRVRATRPRASEHRHRPRRLVHRHERQRPSLRRLDRGHPASSVAMPDRRVQAFQQIDHAAPVQQPRVRVRPPRRLQMRVDPLRAPFLRRPGAQGVFGFLDGLQHDLPIAQDGRASSPRARRPRPVANPSPAAAGSRTARPTHGAAARQGLAGQVAGDLDITGQGQARV